MKRAPIFPPPQFPPVKLRAFQRMPPAVFPAVMGLFGLGLALRRGAAVIGYPPALAEMVLGAVSLLWVFTTFGYLLKLRQRPAVIMEDLAILPGRAGLAAMSLGVFLLAATMLPYSAAAAEVLLFAGLAVHAVLAVLIALALVRGPAEGRHVTPVWHLNFVGFIIAGLVAGPLGYVGLGEAVLIGTGGGGCHCLGGQPCTIDQTGAACALAPAACDPSGPRGAVGYGCASVGNEHACDRVCPVGRGDFAGAGGICALDHGLGFLGALGRFYLSAGLLCRAFTDPCGTG